MWVQRAWLPGLWSGLVQGRDPPLGLLLLLRPLPSLLDCSSLVRDHFHTHTHTHGHSFVLYIYSRIIIYIISIRMLSHL